MQALLVGNLYVIKLINDRRPSASAVPGSALVACLRGTYAVSAGTRAFSDLTSSVLIPVQVPTSHVMRLRWLQNN